LGRQYILCGQKVHLATLSKQVVPVSQSVSQAAWFAAWFEYSPNLNELDSASSSSSSSSKGSLTPFHSIAANRKDSSRSLMMADRNDTTCQEEVQNGTKIHAKTNFCIATCV
jgi:hypothetical protein